MPLLRTLQFGVQVREARKIAGSSGSFDFSLGNLSSLQNVYVFFQYEYASEDEVEEAIAAVRKEAEIHPNSPTLEMYNKGLRISSVSGVILTSSDDHPMVIKGTSTVDSYVGEYEQPLLNVEGVWDVSRFDKPCSLLVHFDKASATTANKCKAGVSPANQRPTCSDRSLLILIT
ncbi:hypothetical protein PR202_gb13435 [Eleusine coracana subsp. coracana]|uniref:Disease resistance R13L4/SHOC-2-like LRR domain-containing protein n=1 Tax=Eleusine coracana subsp. coracana TaxID=191504 RepID=A0AAV5EQ84_ELECO|nr:hypothetical protein PR202_gb13435 [Eleusine coracana subsp. coracana]